MFNNVLAFNTREDYDAVVEKNDSLKQLFYQQLTTISNFKPLKGNAKNTSIPDSLFEAAEFMINILNEDGVVKIGKYLYKISWQKGKVFTMNEVDYGKKYSDLLAGITSDKVGAYDFDFDVLDMVEDGILSQPTEEEMTTSERIRICWKGTRARGDNNEVGVYFRDLSDPSATFGPCINRLDGSPVANTRLKCKVEYFSLGIWHRLDIDAKIQKQSAKIFINNVPLWVTTSAKTGETNWDGFYTIKYRGRCGSDNEFNATNARVPHPISGENKGRIVFWEKSRGLRYYCLIFNYAEIYTNNMYFGPCNNDQFCQSSQNIRYAAPPMRMSTALLPSSNSWVVKVNSKIDCK